MTRRLLVPMDDSEPARNALEYALTTFPDARVTVLHVTDPVETAYGGDTDAAEEFAAAEAVADEHDQEVATEVLESDAGVADAVVDYAEREGFDGVVVGSHGRSGVSHVLLGSVAESIVNDAPMPVTVVR